MNTYRKTAITVGILFIACTVASVRTTQTKKGPLEVRISPGVATPAIPVRWPRGMSELSNEAIRLIM